MTPCGYRVCTGCPTCVTAWATVVGLRLSPWQKALVARMFPPDPPLDRLLSRRPELAQTAHVGVVVRASAMESA